MKNLLITLIGVLAIGATLPAVAGPDWQLIEQGRKAKLARMQQAAPQAQTSGSSTPATSQQSGAEAQKDNMMKECMDMMKKSS